MNDKPRKFFQSLKSLSLYWLIAIPVLASSVAILITRAIETQENRRIEIQTNQFSLSREIAQKVSTATQELATILINSTDGESAFHSNTLLVHAQNDTFNDNGNNEISRLQIVNKGRFRTTDTKGKIFPASQFGLKSFPPPGGELHWTYNATIASNTLVIPMRKEVILANVPGSWFQEILKSYGKETFEKKISGGINENFDWAIVQQPIESEKPESQKKQDQKPEDKENSAMHENEKTTQAGEKKIEKNEKQDDRPSDKNKTLESEGTTQNVFLATSDSIFFRQTLSGELIKAGFFQGPARYSQLSNNLTNHSAIAVIPIDGTNLRLITRWSTTWTLKDIAGIHKSDFILLALIAFLSVSSSLVYRSRFSSLSRQLRQSLANLNPSRSVEGETSQPKTLDQVFQDIFDDATWLYRTASQRQYKYAILFETIKEIVNNEKFFLLYVGERLDAGQFQLTTDRNSRWRICLIRTPYQQGSNEQVFFATAAESILARIIMLAASSYFIDQAASGASNDEAIKAVMEKLEPCRTNLNVQMMWFLVSEKSLASGSIRNIAEEQESVIRIESEPHRTVCIDEEDINAFVFQTQSTQSIENDSALDNETPELQGERK